LQDEGLVMIGIPAFDYFFDFFLIIIVPISLAIATISLFR